MRGIYTYVPETKYVPREYSIAAILLLQFMVLISLVSVLNLLYLYISTFRSMCAVSNMAVFWSSLTSCFPGMFLTYFLNDFEIVPVAPIITGITFVFTFHVRCISIVSSLYFRIFSASFLIKILSPEIATSINIHVPFSLSRFIMCRLLLGIVLSVCTYYYYYYYLTSGPYSSTSVSFGMTAHTNMPSAFFLHFLTPTDFISFSVQSSHLNFGLPAFALVSGFSWNTFCMVLWSDILTKTPAHSSPLTFVVVTIFGFIHISCNLLLARILQALGSLIGPYVFLNILRSHNYFYYYWIKLI